MKATGIVRRIDDLGRVVIPKEIRRTMRIREGDPLEIYTDKEGEVIFKKYSQMGEMSTYAQMYTDTLTKSTGLSSVICDRDVIVAVSGSVKRDILEKPVGEGVERVMESRQSYVYHPGDSKRVQIVSGNEKIFASVCAPVLMEGDVVGAVALILPETGAVAGEGDVKLLQTIAGLLGRQLEA